MYELFPFNIWKYKVTGVTYLSLVLFFLCFFFLENVGYQVYAWDHRIDSWFEMCFKSSCFLLSGGGRKKLL